MKCYVVLFCFSVCALCSTAWGFERGSSFKGKQFVYDLPRVANGVKLTSDLWVWEDASANAKFMEAQRAYQKGQFSTLQRKFASYGFTSSAYWFRIAIYNTQTLSRDLILSVPKPLLDSVDVYCQMNQGRTYYYPLGEQTDFDRRRLKVRHYAVPLTLLGESGAECYFRVLTTSNLTMSLEISDVDTFLEGESTSQWMSGLFYGIAFSILGGIGVLYIVMRDPVYLYYMVHFIGGLGYSSLADGSLSSLWSFLDVENFAVVFFIACWMIGALLFAIELLSIKLRYYRLYQGMLGGIASLLFLLVLYPWGSELQTTETMVNMVSAYTFILLSIGFYCAFRKDNQALFFIVGWGAVSIAMGISQLAATGVIADAGFTTTGIKIGWAIEVVVFSFVLGISLKLMKRRENTFRKGMVTAQDENSEKSQFLAKMSHEIRTPMSGILGLTELLETTPLSPVQKRYLKAIQDSGKSMMNVVNGVLDVSKIEAGKATLKKVPIDVNALLLDCLTVFEMTARKKQLPLIIVVEAGTPLTVMGDPERIRQVIINLLSNALKFTTVGRVTLSISMTDQILDEHLVLKIEVKDTGIGIGDQDKARLFLPFSQIENGRLVNDEGTGLGLMICRQIVGLMNGDIGVHSEPGKGSVFWFTVPFEVLDDCVLSDTDQVIELLEYEDKIRAILNAPLQENGARSAQVQKQHRFEHQFKPILKVVREPALTIEPELSEILLRSRILVAEDNEINCKVISGYLERMGVEADVVNNGQEVLDKFQKEGKQYDLVLMDCEMPVLDGFLATVALHKWQGDMFQPKTPVVALSAHVTEAYIQRSQEVGMLMHVSKPLSYQRLFDAVKDVLGSKVF